VKKGYRLLAWSSETLNARADGGAGSHFVFAEYGVEVKRLINNFMTASGAPI
jgi:hypothetical protein